MIPDLKAPDGFAYEWKRFSIMGDVDEENLRTIAKAGWVAVPRGRYPELATQHQDFIVIGGLILAERSDELQAEAKRKQTKAADDAYNYYAERLEAVLGQPCPRSVNGVVQYSNQGGRQKKDLQT